MVRDLIRAASQPSSAGYFSTAVVFGGIAAFTGGNPLMVILAGCFLVGGVMATAKNWAFGELDRPPDEEAPAGTTVKSTERRATAESLLLGRAQTLEEATIVQELNALAELTDRLKRLGPIEPADMGEQVRQVHHASGESLRRAVELAEAEQQMRTPEVRARVRQSRQRLLDDVSQSLRLLERTVDELQAAKLDPTVPGRSLGELRRELNESLSIARRVEERMKEMDDDASYLRASESSQR